MEMILARECRKSKEKDGGGGVKRTRGEGRMRGECIASNTGWISRLSVYRGYNQ